MSNSGGGSGGGSTGVPAAALGGSGTLALRKLVLDDASVSAHAQAQFLFALAPLGDLELLDLGSLAVAIGRRECAQLIAKPLTHAIQKKHDLLASVLIDSRNAGVWEKGLRAHRARFGVFDGAVVFRDATQTALCAPSDDDAADALHALIAASRDQYPIDEKLRLIKRMLGDDSKTGLVQRIPVPPNLWMYTPGRAKVI